MILRPTAEGLECLAPAKLNLFLEVLGKRPDGYHELETLMVTVGLHDVLSIEDDPSGRITFGCDDPSLPTGSENLVVKAAERLKDEVKSGRGARIFLSKAIPAQAGLAGGSSDAASTLVALDRLWNLQTPPSTLDALAGEIGSDVAFFLHAPSAICRGRGEKIEPVSLPSALHFVLICPPFGVSTAEAFRGVVPPDRPRPIGPIVEAFSRGDTGAIGRAMFNRLQESAEAIQPALGRIREALDDLGPPHLDGHLMSGSGSTWFGLCPTRDAAGHAARHLETLGLGRVRAVTCGP